MSWKDWLDALFSRLASRQRRGRLARTNPYPQFLADLLQRHGLEVVKDGRGVGVMGSPHRLKLDLAAVDPSGDGQVVQFAASLVFATGPALVDFVTGFGVSQDQAHKLALDNYLQTTFHVFAQAAFPAFEARQRVLSTPDGRSLIQGDLTCIGLHPPRPEPEISQRLGDLLAAHPWAPGAHLIKLVHSPADTIVTVDTTEVPELHPAIRALLWPGHAEPYVAKQLLLIQDSPTP